MARESVQILAVVTRHVSKKPARRGEVQRAGTRDAPRGGQAGQEPVREIAGHPKTIVDAATVDSRHTGKRGGKNLGGAENRR